MGLDEEMRCIRFGRLLRNIFLLIDQLLNRLFNALGQIFYRTVKIKLYKAKIQVVL